MFWLIIGAMLAAAVLVIAVPLYRFEKRLSLTSVLAIVTIAAIAGGFYSQIGTPDTETQGGDVAAVEDMVASLAARLRENPNDLQGWKMLGRSYLQTGNFPGAVAAFEKAVAMESSENGQTIADLGEAVLMSDPQTMTGRAGQLFENALALQSDNPKALFYAGMAAVERGNNALAAERWEALLATSPPQNIQDVLLQRIAELRGESLQQVAPVAVPSSGITVNVALGDAAANAGLPDATVFILVRDPNQPSPPVAAVRRRLSELPDDVSISDSDAMMPGRVPSGFAQLEVVARVSLTGQPVAQPGDWYGQTIIETAETDSIQIVIDQQVP